MLITIGPIGIAELLRIVLNLISFNYLPLPLEFIIVVDLEETLSWAGTDGEFHCSPFELEIGKRDYDELIQMGITIGAYWSPLELEIEKIEYAELIQS
jgi:hypothetical protein